MIIPVALPPLTGRLGAILRAGYWALALATIVVVAGSMVFNGLDFFRNVPASMSYGFRTYTAAHRVQIGEVAGPQARSAGLTKGRWLVAIDGAILPADATEYWVGARLAEGGVQTTLAVQDSDGRITRHRVPRLGNVWTATDPSSGLPLWLYSLVSFVSLQLLPIFLIAASILLALRRPHDSEAMLFAVGFLLLCFNSDVAFWVNALLGFSPGVLNMLMVFGWVATLVAVAGFPDGRFATRPTRLVPAGLAVLGVGMGMLPFLGSATATLRPTFNLLAFGLVALAAYAVVRRYQTAADETERQQIKWVAMGFAVTALAVISLIPLEIFGVNVRRGDPLAFVVFALGRLLVFLPLPAGLLVSLLRYRLYDADAAISRSAAYAVLTLSLLAIFAFTEKSVEVLGEEYFGGSLGAAAGGLGAALAAMAIAPLHHRLTHWAEHRFRKGIVRLRSGLPVLVGDMRETASDAAIGEAVLERIETSIRARYSAIIVDNAVLAVRGIPAQTVVDWERDWVATESECMDWRSDDPLFPLRVPLSADGCGLVGWLLVGARPDGSLYGKDEREVLAEIAESIARALAIARERATRAAAARARTEHLEARILSLESLIGRVLSQAGLPRH